MMARGADEKKKDFLLCRQRPFLNASSVDHTMPGPKRDSQYSV